MCVCVGVRVCVCVCSCVCWCVCVCRCVCVCVRVSFRVFREGGKSAFLGGTVQVSILHTYYTTATSISTYGLASHKKCASSCKDFGPAESCKKILWMCGTENSVML